MLESDTRIEDERVRNVVNGRKLFAPITKRRPWTTSRLVDVGEGRTQPLLELIAQAKFVEYDPKEYMAYWKDRNWKNETWDNVEICSKTAARPSAGRSAYGFPAGTPEYYKAYRAKNKDRLYQYHKTRRIAMLDKVKEAEKIVRARAEEAQSERSTILDQGESLLSDLKSLLPREPGT